MRSVLLAGSTNVWLRDRATQSEFVKRSVRRFMPGERIEDALRAAQELTANRITTILSRLGENVTSADEADEVTRHYLDVLDRAAAAGLDAQISVKPTQLGLDLDAAVCARNLDRIVDRADARGNFVWIDMEGSPYVDPTLHLFRRTRARTARVGIALQAYLHRSARDVESLLPLGPAIRIVKGAYLEPAEIAYRRKPDVDENFYRLCVRLLGEDASRPGTLLHIATHDATLVNRLSAHIRHARVPESRYEFAMLYGVQRGLQLRLVREGQRLRVLISYGDYWFPWYMRRLAERPANVWFMMKNLFG